jgi:predicted unusual protein kinase regulating ubiquinone biosynthesis (AarF/ABC1/UbiB family)
MTSQRDPATGALIAAAGDDGTDLGPRLIIRSTPLPAPSRLAVARRLSSAMVVVARRLSPVMTSIARRQPVDDAMLARALRTIFDDLGGSFAKFGQLLGSSPSLFGEVVANEFRTTLDDVAPVARREVVLAIEDELGLPLSHLFASFDDEPLAAASLAVVHRATLLDGTPVAVKVLRPGIEAAMAVDLAVMGPLLGFIGREVAIGIAGELPALIAGFAEQLAEEVDLRNEARSARWFDHLMRTMGITDVVVPLPIEGYVAKRVLVMDFLDGVPVDHVDEIAAMGIDPAPLVQNCVKAWFASAICTGAFHGDVHAGNLLVTRDGRLGVLDWGIVGRLDDDTQQFFRTVVDAALGNDHAWVEVTRYAVSIYGAGVVEQLGVSDEVLVALVRGQIEPLFRRPFGEINLADLVIAPDKANLARADGVVPTEPPAMSTFELWRTERARRRSQDASGMRETSFDRGMFLLSKQLVYFDRYGKLFLPDVCLMWDESAFERLMAEPMVPAEVPFS